MRYKPSVTPPGPDRLQRHGDKRDHPSCVLTCARRRALATQSRTTACWPTATPRLWSTRTARSTGCACPATTATLSSRVCSTPTPATGRSVPSESYSGDTALPARHARDRDHLHDRDRPGPAHRRHGVRRGAARARPRLSTLRTSCCARWRASSGEVELELELAPRPAVRPRHAAGPPRGGRRAHIRRRPHRRAVRRAARGRGLDDPRDVHRRRGRPTGLLRSLGVRRGPERARAHGRGRGRRTHRRHRRGLALLGGRARHLRGAAPRARPDELTRAEGPQLPTHRRDRRRAHHLAARDGRRRAQLGLPLLLDPRLEPDDRGALHRHLLRRGGGVRLLHDQLGRRPRGRGLAPDHVRHRRRARPLGARAAAPARLARLDARCASATAPGTRSSSTSTASCSTRSGSTARSSASCIPRSRRSWPTSPTPPRGAGRRPTRACGRCAASRATTCPRRCSAGRRSTAP